MDSLHFEESHVAIFLENGKNDHFREGSWVFVAHSNMPPCAVAVLEKFLTVGNHAKALPLFRRVQNSKRILTVMLTSSLKRSFSKKDWTQQNLEFTACEREGLQQLLPSLCRTDFFRDMEVGAARKHGTVMQGSH